jgi:hypothetical protein
MKAILQLATLLLVLLLLTAQINNPSNTLSSGATPIVGSVRAAGATTTQSGTLATIGASTAQYHIDAAVYCDTTVATATVTLVITYTDPSNTVQTFSPAAATCTTLNGSSYATVTGTIHATTITYSATPANAANFDFSAVLTQETSN